MDFSRAHDAYDHRRLLARFASVKASRSTGAQLSLNDPDTMQLFSDGRTDAIFQFESSGIAGDLPPPEAEGVGRSFCSERTLPARPNRWRDDRGILLRSASRGEKDEIGVDRVLRCEEILENTFGCARVSGTDHAARAKARGILSRDADLMRRRNG
jgi:hypothetical protein